MQGFLHCVWSLRMPYSAAEGGGENKRKRKLSKPIGDPVRGRDAPITTVLRDHCHDRPPVLKDHNIPR